MSIQFWIVVGRRLFNDVLLHLVSVVLLEEIDINFTEQLISIGEGKCELDGKCVGRIKCVTWMALFCR